MPDERPGASPRAGFSVNPKSNVHCRDRTWRQQFALLIEPVRN